MEYSKEVSKLLSKLIDEDVIDKCTQKGAKNMKCVKDLKVEVQQSGAGYYKGTFDDEGPFCRITGYHDSYENAKNATDYRFDTMEIKYCYGKCKDCFTK